MKIKQDPIKWELLIRLLEKCELQSERGEYGSLKSLSRSAVELKNGFDKMRMSHFLAVTSDDTLSVLQKYVREDANFKDGQPLLDFLINLKGIFDGIIIAPKKAPQKVCIYNTNDLIFAKQLQHLKWFETAQKSNPLRFLPQPTMSHLQQFVYTINAIAKDYFQMVCLP